MCVCVCMYIHIYIYTLSLSLCIYIYIYSCVCVCLRGQQSRRCPLFLHPPALGHLALEKKTRFTNVECDKPWQSQLHRPQFRAGEEKNHDWLVVWNIFIHLLFSLIYGMPSFPLTFTPSFFRGVGLNHQPDEMSKGGPSQMDHHFFHAAAGRFAPLPWGFALADHCRAGRLGAACSLWFSPLQGGAIASVEVHDITWLPLGNMGLSYNVL